MNEEELLEYNNKVSAPQKMLSPSDSLDSDDSDDFDDSMEMDLGGYEDSDDSEMSGIFR